MLRLVKVNMNDGEIYKFNIPSVRILATENYLTPSTDIFDNIHAEIDTV